MSRCLKFLNKFKKLIYPNVFMTVILQLIRVLICAYAKGGFYMTQHSINFKYKVVSNGYLSYKNVLGFNHIRQN